MHDIILASKYLDFVANMIFIRLSNKQIVKFRLFLIIICFIPTLPFAKVGMFTKLSQK